MASITKDKAGKFHIRFYFNGKQIHITKTTKRECEDAVFNYKMQHADEKPVVAALKLPTFETLFNEFIAHKLKNNKESTVSVYQNVYKNHLKYFADKSIYRITVKDIDTFHAILHDKNLSYKMKKNTFILTIRIHFR
jgi:uncharacterized protein YegP (UPF0339 family)